MAERPQMPFQTVETGEAYQPIRMRYDIFQANELENLLNNNLKCCTKSKNNYAWDLIWRDECNALHFESLESFKKDPKKPVKLASLIIKDDALYVHIGSFKRACLLAPLLHKLIDPKLARIHVVDFMNKVFGIDQSLPTGFDNSLDEGELEKAVKARISDYAALQKKCEKAESAEEAYKLLQNYTDKEARKALPYVERYVFSEDQFEGDDIDVMFLGFYIFLRGRELVAIRRWFGQAEYTLADAAEETIEQVFGGMDIDIIE